MNLSIDPISSDKLTMKASGNTISFSGLINNERPSSFMAPFIDQIHNEIISNGLKHINIDLRNLEFLNSAGIREFGGWIMKLDKLSDEQKYTIKFICNPKISWQEASINSLVLFNNELVSYEKRSSERSSSAVFPTIISCPICKRRLKALKAGRFKCPICSGILNINENAQIFSA